MSSYYQQNQGQFSLIPGAGTYLQDQAKAQSAYERAKTQLQSQRQQTQIKAGLNKDYQVDPNAQYGSYQQMLQSQGSELNAASDQAQQRGFFGPGLGNQGESALRYGQAVQSLGFKNSLADYESGYQAQMGDVERQKSAEMLGSLQGAASDAYGDWTAPNSDPQLPGSSQSGAGVDPSGDWFAGLANASPAQLAAALRSPRGKRPINKGWY